MKTTPNECSITAATNHAVLRNRPNQNWASLGMRYFTPSNSNGEPVADVVVLAWCKQQNASFLGAH